MLKSILIKRNFTSKIKTIIRYENASLNWNLGEFNKQTSALGNGLRDSKIKKKALIWMDSNHTAEYLTTLCGCFKANITPINLNKGEKNIDSNFLKKKIKEEKAEILFISPNEKVNGITKSDVLNKIFPELENTLSGQKLKLKDCENLKHIVQTGFYQKNGMRKFRDFLFYANKNFSTLPNFDYKKDLEILMKHKVLKNLNENDMVYFIGDFDKKYNELLALAFGSANKGFFTCFINQEQFEHGDLDFLNDISENQNLVFVTEEKNFKVLEEKVGRKKNLLSF